jgi:hypothetical protein
MVLLAGGLHDHPVVEVCVFAVCMFSVSVLYVVACRKR